MKIYKVDWLAFTQLLLPLQLRSKAVIFALFKAIFTIIEQINGMFNGFRDEKTDEMKYNSQVCYLRGLLNDKFDMTERRIYIDNSPRLETVFVHREGDEQPLMVSEQSENSPVMLISSAAVNTQKGFNVYVPADILNANENAIKAYLNKYKLVTTFYKLIAI